MLYQIHHEFKDGAKTTKTEMIAQTEVNEGQSSHDILVDLLAEVKISHPLPYGAQWLFCDEMSGYFTITEKTVRENL